MADRPDDQDQEYYPEFRTVRRGYDPDEVEAVLDDLYASLNDAVREADEHAAHLAAARTDHDRLAAALAAAQRRVAELERGPRGGSGAFDNVGSRVDDILSAAAVEAAEISRRAREKAQVLHDEAEAASSTRRAEADQYALQVRGRADSEAAGIVDSAAREAERLVAEAQAAVDELAAARDRTSAEIQRLVVDAHDEALRIREDATHRRDLVRAQLAEVRRRVSQALADDPGPAVAAESPTVSAAEADAVDPASTS